MVLCITHSQDKYTIDIVQQQLEKLGVASFRFNSDRFAIDYQFNYALDEHISDLSLLTADGPLRAAQITAVWYRKLWKLQVPASLDPEYTSIFTKEYTTHLPIFFEAIRSVPWMNNMHTDHAVSANKFHQLTTAKSSALTVPQTIMTNSKEAVLEFYERCKKKVVMKLHGTLSRSMQGNQPAFHTSLLAQDDLRQLDSLIYCPMIFQECISKAYELRIAYIDGAFYTGKINTQHTEQGKTDWRATPAGSAKWEPYALPASVEEKIDAFMRQLGLFFGAIDMIKQPDGEYVFLEVNPQGEWGMLQRDLDYPIGETIAEKLVKRIRNG